MVCHIYDVITAPVKSRSRNVKGWRPRGPDAVADFKAELRKIPPDSSVGFLEKSFVEISTKIPFSTQAQRSRSYCPPELANVAEARGFLSQAETPEDKARWGKLLYRRKRKWLAWVARRRFDLSADKLSRSDRSSSRQVRWLDSDDGSGERVFDTSRWPEIAQPFLGGLYTSALETLESNASASHSWMTCAPPPDSMDAKRASTSLSSFFWILDIRCL